MSILVRYICDITRQVAKWGPLYVFKEFHNNTVMKGFVLLKSKMIANLPSRLLKWG